ncbi:SPFH domain-containing protein [Leucothrix pacifica]|uniref:Antifreeze protein n=1 Tax=Leucothrix pacifica TaxID=1247513 RepID=A0A317CBT7_9GAMM|nr:SPFH domain-containing protein [Leucothrix pacifica]PWQ96094.1 antifreeze protein [Leucothrix pacifica]
MGLWDKVFGEFVDVIEWTDNSSGTMVYRFERHNNEIKYGAKLTVRESQVAVFVNEGEIADVLGPGMYQLETKNLPVLSTLQHWDHGFESPFKAEVYFFNTKQFTDLKWGTKNPIMMRDSEFDMVRLRTFGTYSVRINEPTKFINEIVGTDGHFTIDEISDQLRDLITSRYATILGKLNVPVLDLASNYDQLSTFITERISPEFEQYGLELTKVLVENISLPPEVEKALDKRTSMGMVGDLDKYLKYGAAQGMESGNSSTASSAIEMGIGLAMAQNMTSDQNAKTQSASSGSDNDQTTTPPPLPHQRMWHVSIDNQATGPYDQSELIKLVQNGSLTTDSLVWTTGMANWEAVEENHYFTELLSKYRTTPPPLPQ